MRDRHDSLEFLLRADPAAAECESVDAWWPRQAALSAGLARPIQSAIAG